MSLLGPFDRPVALHLRETRRRFAPGWTVAPPAPPHSTGSRRPSTDRPSSDRAQFLTEALLGPTSSFRSAVADVEASVDERVVTWSPSMYTTSRTALINTLLERDDAVDTLDVSTVSNCAAGRHVFVQWRAVGIFDRAAFLDDDVMIEPSHDTIESAGVIIYSFAGTLVDRIECYYDALTLLEQVLGSSGGGD